ncbi:MAG: HlyD family efflux transporter periplasmic adaptor subunit [Thiofilum sp.]|uniref:HlyD family efflux transporter periplasmic adaptor subunit n=1 Tax=Thiofilum sp. TaxID=2212733 RepID=UPI0025CEA4F0|nr:HlyD family efflux transporter periplasmic adaptor subunit [Thiofilum sp.]MBK8453428.1 HlyD family efflux transporter periplasmic adaptor subunit [Thiofilum sp.]
MLKFLTILLKILLPFVVLGLGLWFAKYLMDTAPEPPKRPPVDRTPVVEVQTFAPRDYTVMIRASGTVKARTQSNLVTEVAGKVMELAPSFKEGGYFEKGDVLLTLDDTNYRDSIRIVDSTIAANQASLRQLDVEEQNIRNSIELSERNLNNIQKNLQLAQQNRRNVERQAPSIQNTRTLTQQNINLVQQNLQLAQRNLGLAQKNLNISKQELARAQKLWDQRLIPRMEVDAAQQKVVQQEQSIVQLQQSIVQQQQAIVQQRQQLENNQQQEVQYDQSTVQQDQQVLQQQQAVTQQLQSIENLKGQLATFETRRESLLANIEANKTQRLQQERNLERTKIIAPYTGRILQKNVDIGQYVSANNTVAVIYAADYVEVDIPLTLAQYALLDLPAGRNVSAANYPKVELSLPFGANAQRWTGQVTGTRASLDAQSRQITVVARIDQPFAGSGLEALKIGQFLNAVLPARTLAEVYVVPPATVRQNRDILVMRDNKVHVIPIETLWTNEEEVVIRPSESLATEQVIITPLAQASEGMPVALAGQKKRRGGQGKPEAGQGNASGADNNANPANNETTEAAPNPNGERRRPNADGAPASEGNGERRRPRPEDAPQQGGQ